MLLHTWINFGANHKKVNEYGTLTHVVTTEDVWGQSEFIQLSMWKGKRILPEVCILILSDYCFFPKYMPLKSTVYDFRFFFLNYYLYMCSLACNMTFITLDILHISHEAVNTHEHVSLAA